MSRLIDADALTDKLGTFMEWENAGFVQKCIDDAPTIDAEPAKHGRWIETKNDSRISGHCSSCGWEAHLYEDDVIGMPYCPNCGAKMDKEEDEEE